MCIGTKEAEYAHMRSNLGQTAGGEGSSNISSHNAESVTSALVTWIHRPAGTGKLKVVCSVWMCVLCRYNNQWMIVDYKHFAPGKSDIKEQLFVVLEQIP